jgi:hypothetical protein
MKKLWFRPVLVEKYCDSCGKEDEAVDNCFCNHRNFDKYPKTGFPPGEKWKYDQLRNEQLI